VFFLSGVIHFRLCWDISSAKKLSSWNETKRTSYGHKWHSRNFL